jgi:integrase
VTTLAEAARTIREATRDKSYQETPLGQEVAAYLRQKRKRLTTSSYRNYEGILHKLVIDHADLELADFEPPAGTELVEQFMDRRYADGSPRAYNRNLSIVRDYFKWAQIRGKLQGDPTLAIERAKPRDVYRTTFSQDERTAIIASATDRRDRLALRLLLDYALRKGALQVIQFQHFDFQRRRLTIFTKGRKVRDLPIPQEDFWMELELLKLEWEAQPRHYFMCLVKPIPRAGMRRFPDRMMSSTALHRWWYRQLEAAGVVPRGTTSGERMHKARHTAGQRVLDHTNGNLKAAQKLLGHASISTTADIYVDWDIDQLAATMQDVLGDG